MTERTLPAPSGDPRVTRTDLNNGGGRRDYGPKGCAGIVYHAVVASVLLRLLLKVGAR